MKWLWLLVFVAGSVGAASRTDQLLNDIKILTVEQNALLTDLRTLSASQNTSLSQLQILQAAQYQKLTALEALVTAHNSLLSANNEKSDSLILISLAAALGVGALLGFAAWFVVLRAMMEGEF